MTSRPRSPSASPIRAVPTDGDFPHARRRGVRLACCTTTTCCFTLLLGGFGIVAGFITGVVKAAQGSVERENVVVAIVLGLLRFLVVVGAYTIAGLLIGAAVGFGIDYLFVLG